MNRSIRPGGGLGYQEKKGPLTVSPRENKIEIEMANERMNRAGDGGDDGRHTKNTCLPTHKKRKERERRQSAYSTQMINLGDNLVSYLPEVSRDIHETFCNCQVKISLDSIILIHSSESFFYLPHYLSLSLSFFSR